MASNKKKVPRSRRANKDKPREAHVPGPWDSLLAPGEPSEAGSPYWIRELAGWLCVQDEGNALRERLGCSYEEAQAHLESSRRVDDLCENWKRLMSLRQELQTEASKPIPPIRDSDVDERVTLMRFVSLEQIDPESVRKFMEVERRLSVESRQQTAQRLAALNADIESRLLKPQRPK